MRAEIWQPADHVVATLSMLRHPAFPNDDFLIFLLEREQQLHRFSGDPLDGSESENVFAFSMEEKILDLIGVPPDTAAWLSQKELGDGCCKHGVPYYCRDWVYEWFAGTEEAIKEWPTAKEFLAELRRHAVEFGVSHGAECPKCAAGDRDIHREVAEMLNLNK